MLRPFDAMAAVRMEIPSDLSLVDEVVESATRLAFGQSLMPSEPFSIVLRELLKNAMVHGNALDRSRHVLLAIDRMSTTTLRMSVEDEGCGFDFAAVTAGGPEDEESERTSGYAAIRKHCQRLEVSNSGSRIVAYFILGGRGRLRW